MGMTNDDGYGRVTGEWLGLEKGKNLLAHRWVYRRYHGEIPAGMCVLHTCDVACCVNPDHLYLGTQLQNIKDRVARGRGGSHKITGERHGRSKLTADQVSAIRVSTESGTALADKFGIGKSQVYRIKRGESWKEKNHGL